MNASFFLSATAFAKQPKLNEQLAESFASISVASTESSAWGQIITHSPILTAAEGQQRTTSNLNLFIFLN